MHINDHRIGDEVYIIAEAGSNHNGDFVTAAALVEQAATAGADAVKFQLFRAGTLYAREAEPEYHGLLDGRELPENWLPALKHWANDVYGIDLLVTPFDRRAVGTLVDLGVPALKIASFEATDIPFLQFAASTNLPLIVSTGMCDWEECDRIVDACDDVALLHCVSSYPAEAEHCNLSVIRGMGRELSVPVGFSDHTLDTDTPAYAVLAGAQIIEKHITLDREMDGPDHEHSLEPHELNEMVQRVRGAEGLLGDPVKEMHPSEQGRARRCRRSVVALRDMTEGHVIRRQDITTSRPGTGIPARHLSWVVGQELQRGIRERDVLTPEHVDAPPALDDGDGYMTPEESILMQAETLPVGVDVAATEFQRPCVYPEMDDGA